MIERCLERRVVEKLRALNLAGLEVSGVWQRSQGGVKGEEGASAAAHLAVHAKMRAYESFLLPKADIAVTLALAVRVELAADGERLAEYTQPLMDVLDDWQHSIDSTRADLTVEGFSPAGMRLDGGDVEWDDGRRCWLVTQSFTVRGIVHKERRQK